MKHYGLTNLSILIVVLFSDYSYGQQEDKQFARQVEASLRSALNYAATLQRNGGWAMAWTEDLEFTFGEHRIKDHHLIVVQPPSTPGTGMTFLRASQALNDDNYLEIANHAAQALIAGQLANGGWPHEFYPDKEKRTTATFDDDVTQGATRFLLAMYQETQDASIETAVKRAAQFMLDSQYKNGGWPQRYPTGGGYGKNITLNDQAMMDVMRTLFLCYHEFGDKRYREAAIRGADCFVELRGAPPQAGWAQQFTPDGKPDSARAFEPVGLSTSESMDAARVLKEVYIETGDKKYLEACLPVFEWMKRSQLKNGKWARLYEYGSNRAIYSTAEGEIIYNVDQARPGYGWQGGYYDKKLEAEIKKLLKLPIDLRKIETKPKSLSLLKKQAQAVIQELDAQGRWVIPLSGTMRRFFLEATSKNDTTLGCIHSRTIEYNSSILIDCLNAMNE